MAVSHCCSHKRLYWSRVLLWVFILAAMSTTVVVVFVQPASHPSASLSNIFAVLNVPVAPSFVSMVLMWLIVAALVRRKRLALHAVVLFQVLGALFSLWDFAQVIAYGQMWVDHPRRPWPLHSVQSHSTLVTLVGLEALASLVVCIAVCVLAYRLRKDFPGRVAPGATVKAGAVLAGSLACAVTVNAVALGISNLRIHGVAIVIDALMRAFGVVGNRLTYARVPVWILDATDTIIGFGLIVATAVVLRTTRDLAPYSAADEVRARELLLERPAAEADSLEYFATRRDKRIVFSDDQRAGIAYGVFGGVALASGDPLGPRDAWPGAVSAFHRLARQKGWVPAALSLSEEAGETWVRVTGSGALAMGDEAIISAKDFSLSRAGAKDLRRSVRHARRAGLSVSVRRHRDIDSTELLVLDRLAAAWRTGDDRGFSMALNRPFGDPADGHCLMVTASLNGEVKGLLSFVPWGPNGASLDVMRRHPDAPGGITELMVTTLLEHGPKHGITKISLNFAMFRETFENSGRLGANTLVRVNSRLLRALDSRFQLESLCTSNQKYSPQWHPRFLLFDDLASLPRIMYAAGVAEGFAPSIEKRLPLVGHHLRLSPGDIDHLSRVEESSRRPQNARGDQTRTDARGARLERMRARGVNPYPISPDIPETLVSVAQRLPSMNPGQTVSTAGRVKHRRHHGGVIFFDLIDADAEVQVICEREVLGREAYADLTSIVRTSDIVRFGGAPLVSATGHLSLGATSWRLESAALHALPFRSFTDPEQRLRERSTEYVVRPESARLIRVRATVEQTLREYLYARNFLEMETPILNTVHGGASARPFHTHINAYNTPLTLRIAPELYLKRLLVGGLGPIFEIGRNFRNEGTDATHNPEFTALEAYLPYANYTVMASLTEELIRTCASTLHGREALPLGPNGELLDVTEPWPRIKVYDAVSAAAGEPVTPETEIDHLLRLAAAHDIHIGPSMGPGAVVEELYGELVEPSTVYPTFYVDFPAETSPLTAPDPSDPRLVQRWDLVAGGMEIGTAYSELADPVLQRARFTEQSWKAAAGDPEAMQIDHDFLKALELGMPPAGGLGIGVDRLVMLLTRTKIRDVLAFPFAKPHA